VGAVVHRRPELTPRPAGAGAGDRPRRGAVGRRAGPLVLVLLVASLLGALPVSLTRVGSDSMAPTLSSGDLVLLTRWHAAVATSDVVVVERPADAGVRLVKRVVGIAGDTVAIEDGALVVNGRAVCEPWSDPSRLDGVWHAPVTVPDGSVYLLGDEREGSIDSRSFGPVAEDDIVGVVPARAWPSPGAVATTTCCAPAGPPSWGCPRCTGPGHHHPETPRPRSEPCSTARPARPAHPTADSRPGCRGCPAAGSSPRPLRRRWYPR
jgi:signal peptidase I